MKYRCINPFLVENFDDDGFSKDTYKQITENSIWELDEEPYRFVGDADSIRMYRVWKTKKAKTGQIIEIPVETFNECFEQL